MDALGLVTEEGGSQSQTEVRMYITLQKACPHDLPDGGELYYLIIYCSQVLSKGQNVFTCAVELSKKDEEISTLPERVESTRKHQPQYALPVCLLLIQFQQRF